MMTQEQEDAEYRALLTALKEALLKNPDFLDELRERLESNDIIDDEDLVS